MLQPDRMYEHRSGHMHAIRHEHTDWVRGRYETSEVVTVIVPGPIAEDAETNPIHAGMTFDRTVLTIPQFEAKFSASDWIPRLSDDERSEIERAIAA